MRKRKSVHFVLFTPKKANNHVTNHTVLAACRKSLTYKRTRQPAHHAHAGSNQAESRWRQACICVPHIWFLRSYGTAWRGVSGTNTLLTLLKPTDVCWRDYSGTEAALSIMPSSVNCLVDQEVALFLTGSPNRAVRSCVCDVMDAMMLTRHTLWLC